MRKELAEFFEREKIEYYAVLDYKHLKVINSRLTERSGLLPKSIIIFLLPYYSGECENLSLYSRARDYHLVIKQITDRLGRLLAELYPESDFKGFGDHSPVDERHAALIGGLGHLGNNGLLINEKYGTYVFIADMITDIAPEELGACDPCEILHCEGCGACERACPTGLLRGEGCDCLSAITQRKGELSEAEIELMLKYDTVWGCDICQKSCPHNKDPKLTPIEFFREAGITRLTSAILNGMSEEEFSKRAFAWRGRSVIERNLKYFEE